MPGPVAQPGQVIGTAVVMKERTAKERAQRDYSRLRAGWLDGGNLYGAGRSEAPGHRRAPGWRSADAHIGGRELSRLPRGHHGPRANGSDAPAGRALRG